MIYEKLDGKYTVELKDGKKYEAILPGTLDLNNIGEREKVALKWHPDAAIDDTGTFTDCGKILTRLTRKHAYEGMARFTRKIQIKKTRGKRLFIKVERSRELSLTVNGENVQPYVQGTISTPYVFEITDYVVDGENEISFVCDNSYPNWTHDPIIFSSAATDESQTNWNGLIGNIGIAETSENFINDIRTSCSLKKVDLTIDYDCKQNTEDVITIKCDAFEDICTNVSLKKGRNSITIKGIKLKPDVKLWDEDAGNLYEINVSSKILGTMSIKFGIRTLSCIGGRLALNGRVIFLRSEASSAIYPEEGHIPMSKDRWIEILKKYKSYGANAVRFHSHCPPESAFEAADELGMILQPELSHWNPKTAFEKDEDYAYYKLELASIIKTYANHPSFISLSFGNELAAESKGHKRMELLVQYAKKLDPTRLFADGSNNHYGWLGPSLMSDFYTGTNCYEHELRATFAGMGGYLNRDYPNAKHNFDKQMSHVREEFDKPVIEFEVGQYEILPDFDEIEEFNGVTDPDNYKHVRDRVNEKGLMPVWKDYVNATGELSLICYREEVEASLRTEQMSGISLLSLQDFTGQGTALVGMMNSHLQPKPFDFANPKRFASFFKSVLPLAFLDKYTYNEGSEISFVLKLANYGRADVEGTASASLIDENGKTISTQTVKSAMYKTGKLHSVKTFRMTLPKNIAKSAKYTLSVKVGDFENTYPIWIYKKEQWNVGKNITITDNLKDALTVLEKGGTVFLNPPSDEKHFTKSIKAQFSTDFWSVGTFPMQSGFMGVYLDEKHPAMQDFPTENHSNWQWWQLTHHRAMILPDGVKSIITGLDSYARMRNLSLLFEAKVGKGKLLLSSMNLLQDSNYPEVNAMLVSLCKYVSSKDFNPTQEIKEETLKEIVSD